MNIRPRRNRKSAAIRNMVEETKLGVENLIYPIFLKDGNNIKEEVSSLPNNFRWSIDRLLPELEECLNLGITTFDIFPAVEEELKDKIASYSYAEDNFYLHAIRKIKETFPELMLMSDVALDPYSSDGHDGFVEDGRVGVIRETLDHNGFSEVSIMSYTAKYASAFYGPFRDALNSAPKSGDKKTYQMNPANKREALLEAQLDFEEGADMLMVKPALCYLDVIKLLNENFNVPITAYNVSGECAMVYAAAKNGWLNYERAVYEILLSIRRAGADGILTYFAKDFAQFSKK
jgi:porphobilinogen synthase